MRRLWFKLTLFEGAKLLTWQLLTTGIAIFKETFIQKHASPAWLPVHPEYSSELDSIFSSFTEEIVLSATSLQLCVDGDVFIGSVYVCVCEPEMCVRDNQSRDRNGWI